MMKEVTKTDKEVTYFEGWRNKTHQGNGKRTESSKNITDLPSCAEKLPARLGKDRIKGLL